MNTTDFNSALLLVSVTLPLLAAAGLARPSWRGVISKLAPWTALLALSAVFVAHGTEVSAPWLLLGAHFGLDDIGQVMLAFTAVLWLATGVFARGYLTDDPRQWRFFLFHLLAMSGNFTLILAQDMPAFYLGFALMSFSAYGLVIHHGDADALRAGRVYLWLVVAGELLLFAGMILAATNAGSFLFSEMGRTPPDHAATALLLLGFGIKVGVLPLHFWLPLAHPAAPVPASAVLSGAMIKAGLLGWLRFLPPGTAGLEAWGQTLLVAGAAAAFYGVFVGVTQRNAKTVLAYSSISQMGLLTVGVGVAMAQPALRETAVTAVLIYALHHGLTKGALFLGVGVASMAATPAQRRLAFGGLCLAALALAGGPLTSGAMAKAALKADLPSLPAPWPAWLAVLLPLAAVGTTLLMARFLWLVRNTERSHAHGGACVWWTWGMLLVLVSATPWVWPQISALAAETLPPVKLWLASWPILSGAVLAWLAWRWSARAGAGRGIEIPAGDVFALPEWLWRRACRWRESLIHGSHCTPRREPPTARPGLRGWPNWMRLETQLRHWPVAGLLLLGLVAVLFILLLRK